MSWIGVPCGKTRSCTSHSCTPQLIIHATLRRRRSSSPPQCSSRTSRASPCYRSAIKRCANFMSIARLCARRSHSLHVVCDIHRSQAQFIMSGGALPLDRLTQHQQYVACHLRPDCMLCRLCWFAHAFVAAPILCLDADTWRGCANRGSAASRSTSRGPTPTTCRLRSTSMHASSHAISRCTSLCPQACAVTDSTPSMCV